MGFLRSLRKYSAMIAGGIRAKSAKAQPLSAGIQLIVQALARRGIELP
jgi:hypothetical protein